VVSRAPSVLLSEVLSRAGITEALILPGSRRIPSSAEIFDAYAYPGREAVRNHLEQYLEVVALPRSRLVRELHPGDLMVRRAEGGLGHMAMLTTGETFRQEELTALGVKPESARSGYYSEVIEAGLFPHRHTDRFARRLGDENGQLSHDSLILRVRHDAHNSLHLPLSVSSTSEGQLWASRASGASTAEIPGAAGEATRTPSVPPVVVAHLPLGFDISEGNGPRPPTLADFIALKQAGKSFGILKVAQYEVDHQFDVRYPLVRAAGMIRGSYDFFAPIAVATQVQWVVDHVKRLTPGDLAPALDLEDGKKALDRKYHYTSGNAGRQDLFKDISIWLKEVETRLGRAPIMYVGVLWREQFKPAWVPAAADMSAFPLWTAHPIWVGEVTHTRGEVLSGWSDYTIWQYAEDKRGDEKRGHPSKLWGVDPYFEPGTEKFDGMDYDAYNGTIYGLRGLADLGHTAPHLIDHRECIAYTEPDGRVHLLELVAGAWRDQDLSTIIPTAPLAAGDPAAIGVGSEQFVFYRTNNGYIHVLTRLTNVNGSWSEVSAGQGAIDDPFVTLVQNDVHVVYWNEVNHHVHLSRQSGGTWHVAPATDLATTPSPPHASGSAVAYMYQNVFHFVSRAGSAGHLMDSSRARAGGVPDDLTATARDSTGHPPPAATYRPATYTPVGKAPRIVFRAVRGDIWQIERDTLLAKNLSLDAGHAPSAAGSPTALVTDRAHVFYRTMDGTIVDIFDDAGVWHRQNVCTGAAADPTAFVDSLGHAAVSFRAMNGAIRVARFVSGAWKCEDATRPQSGDVGKSPVSRPAPGPAPDKSPASRPAPSPATDKGPAGRSALSSATEDYSLKGIADGTLGTLPDDILVAILTKGESDANALTDRVFWQQHPELSGKMLDPREPKQQALRDEWGRISHWQVKPIIWLRQLIDELDRHRGDIPREFLLGWVAVESDGRVSTVTSLGERGYFQIMWKGGEAQEQLSLTWSDFQRLSTDRAFSIEKGVQLAKAYRQYFRRNYPAVPDGSDLLWRLTKGRHGLPSAINRALDRLVKAGTAITWQAVSQGLPEMVAKNVDHTLAYAAKLKQLADRVPPPALVK
jgi:GH25 family lysozyme M1 (1,4-beta-N-acetylmuramidase)